MDQYVLSQIFTNCVVLAAGAWSRDLARKIGVEIPTMVNKHSYIISDIIPGINSYPNVRFYDHSIYFKVRSKNTYTLRTVNELNPNRPLCQINPHH